jgi:phosphatidylglycerophosphate synthase
MFDAQIRSLIDPPLNRFGRLLSRAGVTADGLTILGCALGLLAAIAIAMQAMLTAVALFAAGRMADGLDGAVSRATAPTDRGGYLDIVLDFAVYAAIPLGFAVLAPVANALAAATLLAAIMFNGSSFLAFAIMAERRGITSKAQGTKSLYYAAGLAEGTETIVAYLAIMLWPAAFPVIAYGFAGLCAISGGARIVMAWRLLGVK